MLAIIPVMTVSLLYGMWPGICFAILTLPLNLLLYLLNNTQPASHTSLMFGTIGLIAIAVVLGRMKDISKLLKMEVIERHRAEKELKKHKDVLALTIQQKTGELKSTNEQLEYLLEASLDPIIISGKAASVIRANKAFLRLLNYSEQEVLGEHLNSFFILTPGSYETNTGDLIEFCQKDVDEAVEKVGELLKQEPP